MCQAICLLLKRNKETTSLPFYRQVFCLFHTTLHPYPQGLGELWSTYPSVAKVLATAVGQRVFVHMAQKRTIRLLLLFFFFPKILWQRRASSLQLENCEGVSLEAATSQLISRGENQAMSKETQRQRMEKQSCWHSNIS